MTTTRPDLSVPPRVTELDTLVLLFLFDAEPVPVFTGTLARAIFSRPGGNMKTALGRAWRTLDALRKEGLVKSIAAPTIAGRPPHAWYLTESTIAWLVDSGRVDSADWKRKPRHHKAKATLLAREHEHHVHAVRAELQHVARVTSDLALESLTFAERNAVTFEEPGTGVVLTVEPDLRAVLTVGPHRLLLLVEVQGTAPRLKEVTEKMHAYANYLSSPELLRRFEVDGVRIGFITFSDDPAGGLDHAWNVMEAILDFGQLQKTTFVAPLSAVLRDGLLSPIFVTPASYRSALARSPVALRDRFHQARHAGNARRAERNAFIGTSVTHDALVPLPQSTSAP